MHEYKNGWNDSFYPWHVHPLRCQSFYAFSYTCIYFKSILHMYMYILGAVARVNTKQENIHIIITAPEHGPFIRCGASHLIYFHIHAYISNPFSNICMFLFKLCMHLCLIRFHIYAYIVFWYIYTFLIYIYTQIVISTSYI